MAENEDLRTAIKFFMAIVFAGWMLVRIMRPTRAWTNDFWNPLLKHISNKAYGDTGAYTLIYTAPILLVAFMGAIYLSMIKKTNQEIKTPLKMNPWNYPVFVRGPLALISLSEIILLGAFVALFGWTTAKLIKNSLDRINIPDMAMPGMHMHMDPLWERKFNIVGGKLGAAGAVPFAFLFFPIARFSSLFQLIKIPFEHSVRYHIWTGHIMMVMWSAHAIVYIIYWPIAHKSHEFIKWGKTDIAGFTGLVAWTIGLAIWLTSLNPVRKQKFELFYYTHQLYIVFVIFFVFHVGEKWLTMMVAGIFLFMIDRLFRFLQSRRRVEVVSARIISWETMELTFAKLPNLYYPAASVIFLNLPAISRLQWHPFTVITSSNVETDRISILVKCSGKWTYKLKEIVVRESEKDGPSHFEAAVEGPHGHNLDYIHIYKTYLFIAGGSGIAPFMSIIKDLLHRMQNKQAPPVNKILLVWAVRNSDELNILHTIKTTVAFAGFEVHAYITRQDEEEQHKSPNKNVVLFAGRAAKELIHAEPSPTRKVARLVRGISAIKGYKLYAATILTSFIGYMFLAGLIHRFYIYPLDHNTYSVCSRSGRGFVSLMEYVLGVSVFGGGTIIIWNCYKGKKYDNHVEAPVVSGISSEDGVNPCKIHYGSRPDIQGIISEFDKDKKEYVGVFTCGPEGMQKEVGLQCRIHKLNFHPLNFEL